MRLIVQVGQCSDRDDVVKIGLQKKRQTHRSHRDRIDQAEDKTGHQDHRSFPGMNLEVIGNAFERNVNDDRKGNAVGKQHRRDGDRIAVHDIRIRQQHLSVQIGGVEQCPEKQKHDSNHGIQDGIRKGILCPVPVQAEQLPVIDQKDPCREIQRQHQRKCLAARKGSENKTQYRYQKIY